MDIQRFESLFRLYLDQQASPEEEREMMYMLADPANAEGIRELIGEYWSFWPEKFQLRQEQSDKILKEIKLQIASEPKRRVLPAFRFRAAAAAILILLAVGGYFMFSRYGTKIKPDAAEAKQKAVQDIAPPSGARAILTMSNGIRIVLDSLQKGAVSVQGAVSLKKLDNDLLAYHVSGNQNNVFHTLTVPKGSRPMRVLLADGTMVWLNAASSLTYPAYFTGAARRVAFTGEVYFEVTKNKAMPFVVKKLNDSLEISVLGTHFNVNGYDDEAAVKVTLLEGLVNVSSGHSQVLLKPGQQAQAENQLNGNTRLISVSKNVDTVAVMAWKNGKFRFEEADIQTIMRQLSRAYDITVVYQDKIAERFGGTISRNVNLSQVLQMLEATDELDFSIDNRQVTVMRKR